MSEHCGVGRSGEQGAVHTAVQFRIKKINVFSPGQEQRETLATMEKKALHLRI